MAASHDVRRDQLRDIGRFSSMDVGAILRRILDKRNVIPAPFTLFCSKEGGGEARSGGQMRVGKLT